MTYHPEDPDNVTPDSFGGSDYPDAQWFFDGRNCMNGHRHTTETDAIMCEIGGPTEVTK